MPEGVSLGVFATAFGFASAFNKGRSGDKTEAEIREIQRQSFENRFPDKADLFRKGIAVTDEIRRGRAAGLEEKTAVQRAIDLFRFIPSALIDPNRPGAGPVLTDQFRAPPDVSPPTGPPSPKPPVTTPRPAPPQTQFPPGMEQLPAPGEDPFKKAPDVRKELPAGGEGRGGGARPRVPKIIFRIPKTPAELVIQTARIVIDVARESIRKGKEIDEREKAAERMSEEELARRKGEILAERTRAEAQTQTERGRIELPQRQEIEFPSEGLPEIRKAPTRPTRTIPRPSVRTKPVRGIGTQETIFDLVRLESRFRIGERTRQTAEGRPKVDSAPPEISPAPPEISPAPPEISVSPPELSPAPPKISPRPPEIQLRPEISGPQIDVGTQTQLSQLRSDVRSRQKDCPPCDKKRPKKRRTICKEGFFEEGPLKTKFVAWRRVNCTTRQEILTR